jgi:hypothetical protein
LATRELAQERIHSYGKGRAGYFWSAGPGMVLVSVRHNHTELLLAQVHFADGDNDVAEAYKYAASHDPTYSSGISYDVAIGPVVVAWSPQAAADLETGFNIDQRTANAPGELLDLATAKSGVAIWLQPGQYAARTGHFESHSWGLSWCLLAKASK